MKKLTIMLCVISALVAFMPLKVSAAGFVKTGDSYCNDTDISGGAWYGTFKKGSICYKYTDEANGIKEWTYYLTPSSSLKTLYYEIQPSSTIEIQSVKVNSSAFLAETEKTSTGHRVLLSSNNPNGVTNGTKVLLFTVTTKDLAKEGCYLDISPLSIPKCEVIGSNYYDNNGNNVTQAEFEAACGSGTPIDPDEPDIPDSPQTGSVIPYVAVGGGLLAIAGVYFFSRKSNKMYKI